jgi:hypothetical protein
MSATKDALELTTRTIDRRAFYFRNLVVLLVLAVLVFVVWAIVQLSGLPLLGLFLLLPLCGGFLLLDTYLVNHWRNRVLQMWAEEQLHLGAFIKSISTVRMLPPGTLTAMLATLPTSNPSAAAGKLSPAMKRALAVTLMTIHRCECDRIGFANLGYLVGAAAFVTAVIKWSWIPLVGVLLVLPIFAGLRCLQAARWRRWHRTLASLGREAGLELPRFVQLAADLDWGSIAENRKQRLLTSLSDTAE